MATRQDDGGSRLWRGMRHLIFGEDSEPTLRAEIEEAIDEAEESGPIAGDLSPTERQMLRNLLHFGEQTAGEIAVTRGDIMAVPSTISFDDLVRAFADAGHSRLPVYGESLDEVIGMIHIKDVFIANVDPSKERAVSSEDDEVDTLGGLVFLLAGHIPAKGECVTHPSGWKLEAVESDPRKIIRVRLHAPDNRPPDAD
jgi:CBS domain containing-hemolysin-like protein